MNAIPSVGLTLEPQTAAHAEAMFVVLSDPALYEFESEPPPSIPWLAERFRQLETRRSGDGQQHWLNWVLREAGGELIGFVQATVRRDGRAQIAYMLGSTWWGKGYASRAVAAMLAELHREYAVTHPEAVFKQDNHRSRRLLERLNFLRVDAGAPGHLDLEPDENIMARRLS
ncbi:MAG: ribosomal-protein-alanine N-acetyltransferase [Pseudohongiellaceae bacterium]|jgi:ribosomal-protein-alanine N-acetyltransferase